MLKVFEWFGIFINNLYVGFKVFILNFIFVFIMFFWL